MGKHNIESEPSDYFGCQHTRPQKAQRQHKHSVSLLTYDEYNNSITNSIYSQKIEKRVVGKPPDKRGGYGCDL